LGGGVIYHPSFQKKKKFFYLEHEGIRCSKLVGLGLERFEGLYLLGRRDIVEELDKLVVFELVIIDRKDGLLDLEKGHLDHAQHDCTVVGTLRVDDRNLVDLFLVLLNGTR